MIRVALPKGRLLEDTLLRFRASGIIVDIPSESRRLSFVDEAGEFQFLMVRAQDVPVYVEYGAADIGVAGLDVLREKKSKVFELADLGIGYCRMVVAGVKDECLSGGVKGLRVATKFPNIAKRHFISKGIRVDVIKLYGSVELAPLLGLADCIVDIVQTGKTLKENGLRVIEEIFESTAFLISNRVSYYTKNRSIKYLLSKI